MKEIWGPTWFVSALCAIVLVGTVFSRLEVVAISHSSVFLPVVFGQMSLTIQTIEQSELTSWKAGVTEGEVPMEL